MDLYFHSKYKVIYMLLAIPIFVLNLIFGCIIYISFGLIVLIPIFLLSWVATFFPHHTFENAIEITLRNCVGFLFLWIGYMASKHYFYYKLTIRDLVDKIKINLQIGKILLIITIISFCFGYLLNEPQQLDNGDFTIVTDEMKMEAFLTAFMTLFISSFFGIIDAIVKLKRESKEKIEKDKELKCEILKAQSKTDLESTFKIQSFQIHTLEKVIRGKDRMAKALAKIDDNLSGKNGDIKESNSVVFDNLSEFGLGLIQGEVATINNVIEIIKERLPSSISEEHYIDIQEDLKIRIEQDLNAHQKAKERLNTAREVLNRISNKSE